ncbi:putative RDD family membrane protein YckC [Scopulibacillus daqui]|uniref:RDD family membrane protein YckC n=1 Tax=Scopulibacillus daqui TaxID=1469162 RepID=A0ABS2PVH3_9BACL|nr:RDD family protein [Scopulibacillus daqui]MBM7643958.1 putative RDD family membrane protein YckC [Scopulibacillus daqui]
MDVGNTAITEQYAGDANKHAGFWIRFLAVILDGIFVFFAIFVLVFIGELISALTETASIGIIFIIIAYIGAILYQVVLPATQLQGTLGKYILGLKIIHQNGNRIGIGRSICRSLSCTLSGMILYIGYMMAGFTKEKTALHDMICSTYVVYKNK